MTKLPKQILCYTDKLINKEKLQSRLIIMCSSYYSKEALNKFIFSLDLKGLSVLAVLQIS